MGFLSGLVHTLFPISNFFGGGNKNKADPYASLMAQLNPLINQASEISGTAGKAGIANIDTASKDYNYVSDFLKNILTGSDDNLLKMLDASGITAQMDENQQQSSELSVRGGARAGVLSQASSDRSAALNKTLQSLRFAAPNQLAQIAQGIGNLGLGELSASTGAGAQASNVLFNVEGLRQADADRRAQLIGSIFEAIGTAAGGIAAACVSIHGSHFYVPSGKIAASFIKEGDEVCSFDKITGEKVIRKVIRVRKTERQLTKIVSNGNMIIRPTLTHEFCNSAFEGIVAGSLEDYDLLSNINGKGFRENPITIFGEEFNDVIIIKLDDEEDSYPMIVNSYICLDDNPMIRE